MTITYTVSPLHGGFFTHLFKWKGSIWKHIWKKLLVFSCIYIVIGLVYRLALDPHQKKTFQMVALYLHVDNKKIPLTFILGFYVNQVIRRWYDQYTQVTKLDGFMIYVTAMIKGANHIRTNLIRRTLARYANVACIMVWRKMVLRIKKRFPQDKHLIQAGLLTEEEKAEIDELQLPYSGHLVPLLWMTNIVAQCHTDGMLTDYQLDRLITEINKIRSQLGMLSRYEWIQIPLIYTQVATLATYGYFLLCTIGRQYTNEDEIDLYVPIFTILEFVFYMGWLQVAEDLFNPFGDDEEDFEMNYIVDKNIQNGYILATTLHGRTGGMRQDPHWDSKIVQVGHTVASSQVEEHLFSSHLNSYRLSERDMGPVDHQFAKTSKPEKSLVERLRKYKAFQCCIGEEGEPHSPKSTATKRKQRSRKKETMFEEAEKLSTNNVPLAV